MWAGYPLGNWDGMLGTNFVVQVTAKPANDGAERLLAAHLAQAQMAGSRELELDGTRQAGRFVPVVEPHENIRAIGGEGEELP